MEPSHLEEGLVEALEDATTRDIVRMSSRLPGGMMQQLSVIASPQQAEA
jgi:hypothetical protein